MSKAALIAHPSYTYTLIKLSLKVAYAKYMHALVERNNYVLPSRIGHLL